MLERQSGLKLKRLRTDNGTELVNDKVEDLCKRNRIIHETTVPYGPEQNGITERTIATYFKMVRCMLHSAGMDLRYWGEALMYTVHIHNLSPMSTLPGMVPYEAWTGRKPDISHLWIFGSIAYANIPKKIRGGKLEATSVKCRLLGWWADETKGYCLEDLETKTLITSCDVRFVEDLPPTDLAIIEGIDPRPPSNVPDATRHEDTGTSSDPLATNEREELDEVVEDVVAPTRSKEDAVPRREPSKRQRRPAVR